MEKAVEDELFTNSVSVGTITDQMDPQIKARSFAHQYVQANSTEDEKVAFSAIKVVWFCKTLQNWKAMVADISPDGMFFEVTYNGDKKETYLDAYKKIENVRIPD